MPRKQLSAYIQTLPEMSPTYLYKIPVFASLQTLIICFIIGSETDNACFKFAFIAALFCSIASIETVFSSIL